MCATVRTFSGNEFYLRCRTAYKIARADRGASNRVLRLKSNKVATVTHYFSQLKLWKDCTTDPFWTWLQNYQVGAPDEDDSNVAQFGDDNDAVEDNNSNLKDEEY